MSEPTEPHAVLVSARYYATKEIVNWKPPGAEKEERSVLLKGNLEFAVPGADAPRAIGVGRVLSFEAFAGLDDWEAWLAGEFRREARVQVELVSGYLRAIEGQVPCDRTFEVPADLTERARPRTPEPVPPDADPDFEARGA